MNNFHLEAEYMEIMLMLLSKKYNINSLIKLVFMAFCIKNGKIESYRGRKKDFIDVFFSSINIKLLSHPNEMKAIFEVIYKLKSSGWISIDGDFVTVLKNLDDFKYYNDFLRKYDKKDINPIKEVNKLDSKAFVEEVLRHV